MMKSRKFFSALIGGAAMVAMPVMTLAADGAAVFTANCVKCHGADGKADTPTGKAMKAANLTDPKITGGNVEELFKANKKHASIASKVSAEDLTAVAAYVKTLK